MMVNLENYEEYMLLEADGELNEAEKKALYAFLEERPELKKELEAYRAAHLAPDMALRYDDKEGLLRKSNKTGIIRLDRRWIYAMAAAVLVFLFIGIYNSDKETSKQVITKTEKAVPKPGKNITNDSPAIPVSPGEKTLHSQPVNPIVYQKKKQQPAPAESLKPASGRRVLPVKQAESEHIAKAVPEKPVTNPVKPVSKPDNKVNTETVAQQAPNTDTLATEEQTGETRNLLAWEELKEERLRGVNDFSETITDKLEQVRAFKNKIKDSEIAFKIGKKELFVVKL